MRSRSLVEFDKKNTNPLAHIVIFPGFRMHYCHVTPRPCRPLAPVPPINRPASAGIVPAAGFAATYSPHEGKGTTLAFVRALVVRGWSVGKGEGGG